jgi:hypothetical protein
MRARDAAPGEAVAATPRHDEVNNSKARSIARSGGPIHVAEVIPAVIWQLALRREAARSGMQP